jgi:hypothetical protein
MAYEKYNSILYQPIKPFNKMSMRELCDHNKLTLKLDKMSLDRITKIENIPEEKRKIKIFNLINKKIQTRKVSRLKKSTRRKTKKLHLNKKYFLKLKK